MFFWFITILWVILAIESNCHRGAGKARSSLRRRLIASVWADVEWAVAAKPFNGLRGRQPAECLRDCGCGFANRALNSRMSCGRGSLDALRW